MKSDIKTASALSFAAIILLAALLHMYWALGGSWFLFEASGGAIEPGSTLGSTTRLATWGLIVGMVAAAFLVLGRVKLLGKKVPQWFYGLSCWVMAVCMLFGAILNFSIDRVWDRFVFGPIFLLLFLLLVTVAVPDKGASKAV